jgi:hypothetical protein
MPKTKQLPIQPYSNLCAIGMVSPMGRWTHLASIPTSLAVFQTSNPPSPVLTSTSYITKNVQNYGTMFQNHDLERIRGIKIHTSWCILHSATKKFSLLLALDKLNPSQQAIHDEAWSICPIRDRTLLTKAEEWAMQLTMYTNLSSLSVLLSYHNSSRRRMNLLTFKGSHHSYPWMNILLKNLSRTKLPNWFNLVQ